MRKIILTACVLSTGLAAPVLATNAFAANATHPYQNCDRKVDNCGPTGDDRTDQLNAQQLGGSPQTAPMPPAGTPPQGMSQ